MKMPLRNPMRAFFVAAVAASCAPFATADADGGTASDASVVDATDAAVTSDSADAAQNVDAPVLPSDGGFCSKYPDAIHCFDFDGAPTPAGLTVGLNQGTIMIAPTFAGGSPPSALVAATQGKSGRAVATLPTIDLLAHASKTVTVDFLFSVTAAATAPEYIARLNFSSQSSPIALDSSNGLQCGGNTFASLALGPHTVSLSMMVDGSGAVTSFRCSLDGVVSPPAAVVSSHTLSVELGNANSTGGNFTVSYDNLLVRQQ